MLTHQLRILYPYPQSPHPFTPDPEARFRQAPATHAPMTRTWAAVRTSIAPPWLVMGAYYGAGVTKS